VQACPHVDSCRALPEGQGGGRWRRSWRRPPPPRSAGQGSPGRSPGTPAALGQTQGLYGAEFSPRRPRVGPARLAPRLEVRYRGSRPVGEAPGPKVHHDQERVCGTCGPPSVRPQADRHGGIQIAAGVADRVSPRRDSDAECARHPGETDESSGQALRDRRNRFPRMSTGERPRARPRTRAKHRGVSSKHAAPRRRSGRASARQVLDVLDVRESSRQEARSRPAIGRAAGVRREIQPTNPTGAHGHARDP
jgi:hypothetical protein